MTDEPKEDTPEVVEEAATSDKAKNIDPDNNPANADLSEYAPQQDISPTPMPQRTVENY